MSDWMPRLLGALLCLVLGSAAGWVLGGHTRYPFWSQAGGAALGVAAWVLYNEWQVARVLRWLHTASDQPGPRSAGLWGEMAYRIERELRTRDRQLTAHQERLAQFLDGIEASPNGVLLLDTQDQIAWSNHLAAAHLGLDVKRDLHQPITNLVRVPEFVNYLKSGDWAEPVVFSAGTSAKQLSLLMRRYGDGQTLVLTQDITERLQMEAMRRDFVANVSHEIRTPLTVLAGFVETMASLPLSEAERARVLQLMQQQAQRMQALVIDLLSLSQLEGGPRPPVDSWVPVERIVQQAVGGRPGGLSKGRHDITVQGDVTGAALAGSEPELQSALGNLLTNAVRYTPEGGRIAVQWRWSPEQGAAELSVVDNGPGIAREHLPRLTERFYRVDGSRSRETGGTGLGLSIVKHVMQRHGGGLQIESTVGAGANFKLVFPATRVRLVSANTPA